MEYARASIISCQLVNFFGDLKKDDEEVDFTYKLMKRVGLTEGTAIVFKLFDYQRRKLQRMIREDISSEHYNTMLKYSACDEDVDLGRPCLSLNCKCTGFKPHPWRSVLYFCFPNQQQSS
ncbi:hypothetical protein WUBG_00538 [Wuchereria bancrofti]|uniref:Uncharacterized protein n=1 Tax=Wuchereria bancrofti TaxID=6293 RepID=J9F248_WUCBA|nr:hypothetical protein WUBG_00538 [Wuchereria bancrofti]